jgi:hypothetical protein
MHTVMLLHRIDLRYGVETRLWHIRTNRLAKPPEVLQLLLLPEHQFASGDTLERKHEFGMATKSLVDLGGYPIEPSVNLLLISARELDTRVLRDFRLYGDRSVV